MQTIIVMILALASGISALESHTIKQAPIREQRKLALSGELGWNGLVGLGPVVTYYAVPRLGVDAGLGIGGMGYKLGGRARFVFLRGNWSPYLGAGIIYETGTLNRAQEIKDENGVPFKLQVTPMYFIQLVQGLERMGPEGFVFSLNVGYAARVGGGAITYPERTPSLAMRDALNLLVSSGLVFALGAGIAF